MRLKRLKISGFKSFADTTVIDFPGSFVGVVGPNGCGKSNIIDAVRWVMGEGRAGELRATSSMQELIFAGSDGRAPAGRASVEMVLDNADGTVGGLWSTYAELSIKRVLTREGQSSYLINNQAVRRRDVQDIFMGTGLGPRSYAIISQGMVSGFVRAKPEELRVYFEEAAGVSRYKERRREAEGRLAATRANLERVEDLQEERRGDIERLEGEAAALEKWTALDAKKRMLEAAGLVALEAETRDALEKTGSKIASEMALIEEERAKKASLQKDEAAAASDLAAAKTEEDRRSKALSDLSLRLARTQSEASALAEKRRLLEAGISRDAEKLSRASGDAAAFRSRARELLAEAERLSSEADAAKAASEKLGPETAALREKWEKLRDASREASNREREAQKTLVEVNYRLQSLRRESEDLEEREERLASGGGDELELAEADLEEARTTLEEFAAALEEREEAEEAAAAALAEAEEASDEAAREKSEAEAELAGSRTRLAALKDVQAKALSGAKLPSWSTRHGLDLLPRLLHGVEIEPGWARAVEAALSSRAGARVSGSLEAAGTLAQDPPPARFAIASTRGAGSPGPAAGTLAEKVRGGDAASLALLRTWLSRAKTAGSVGEAWALAAASPGSMYITKEGHTATSDCVLFWAPEGEGAGTLERASEIKAIEAAQENLLSRCSAALSVSVEAGRRRTAADAAAKSAALAKQRTALDHNSAKTRVAELEREAAAARRRAGEAKLERGKVEKRLIELEEEIAAAEDEFEKLDSGLSDIAQAALDAEIEADAARGALDEADGSLRDERSRAELLRTNAAHAKEKAADAEERSLRSEAEEAELTASIEESRALIEEIDEKGVDAGLAEVLEARGAAEESLKEAQGVTAEAASRLEAASGAIRAIDEAERPRLERVGELRVREGGLKASLASLTERVEETGIGRAAVMEAMGGRLMKPKEAEREAGKVEREIGELGPVNHAAKGRLEDARRIFEATVSQVQDLTEAASTLESAIRKIDSETRSVLSATFDKVRKNFDEVFQAIFKGGRAALEMTGDEVLEAGIEIRAQPPGKRNASVKLLSGGEQALTATALVFALFRLNPAPFCLLDEVDAPLDEANQLRLADLIRSMSGSTQFVAVTHHRSTMEAAGELIGVTMREPGVSRVVSVDITEAARYAQSAG